MDERYMNNFSNDRGSVTSHHTTPVNAVRHHAVSLDRAEIDSRVPIFLHFHLGFIVIGSRLLYLFKGIVIGE